MALRFFECTKPVIGAINGPAVGVGVTMTLPFDVRLASTTAKFGFVFARRGLVPEACSSWFLPRVVGISRAMEWCATGRVFGPDEALAGGLVRAVHEPDDLLPAAHELAGEIAPPRPRCRSRSPGRCCGGCSVRRTPWTPTASTPLLIDAVGRGADVREGVMQLPREAPARLPRPRAG